MNKLQIYKITFEKTVTAHGGDRQISTPLLRYFLFGLPVLIATLHFTLIYDLRGLPEPIFCSLTFINSPVKRLNTSSN